MTGYSNRRSAYICSKMHSAVFNFQNIVTWFIKKKKKKKELNLLYLLIGSQRKYMYIVKVNSLFLHKFLYKALTIKSSRCLPDG